MATIPEILRKRRKELKLKPEEVAEKIGVSKRTYEYYEDGVDPTTPKPPILKKIAEVLQFKVADLYDDKSQLHDSIDYVLKDDAGNVKGYAQAKVFAGEQKDEIKLPTEVEKSIDAITIIARANEKLADSNQRLTLMLEQERKAVSVQTESPQVAPAMLSGIRELLVEVALGKRFGSRQEVHALLNRVDPVAGVNTFAKDTQKG